VAQLVLHLDALGDVAARHDHPLRRWVVHAILPDQLQDAPRSVQPPDAQGQRGDGVGGRGQARDDVARGGDILRVDEVEGAGAVQVAWIVAQAALIRWAGIAHDAPRVQDRDQVRRVLGQRAEAFLARAQDLFGVAALRDVRGHPQDTHRDPGLVAEGRVPRLERDAGHLSYDYGSVWKRLARAVGRASTDLRLTRKDSATRGSNCRPLWRSTSVSASARVHAPL